MGNNVIPRAISGKGQDIYIKMIKPILSQSYQYDRVTSFYSPKSLAILLNEFTQIWEKGGTVRLIIGFHERMAILPVLKSEMDISEVIKNAVKKAMNGIIDELTALLDSKNNNTLSIIKEIINQKGIKVLLVAPKTNYEYYEKNKKWPIPEIGIFHSKFMIMHHIEDLLVEEKTRKDRRTFFRSLNRFFFRPSAIRRRRNEKYSVITSSMNESERGYTENIEDAVLHRSWIEGEDEICDYFLDRFEEIWLGNDLDVISMPFTGEFIEILKSIESKGRIDYFSWEKFSKFYSNTPIYQGIAFPKVGLLPHQIGVYREALNRWPLRVLLADEVGLGKTVEAGAIIDYMIKYAGVKRVAILTPASLRKQWQLELKKYFDMDFWLYNSTEKICEKGDEIRKVKDKPLSYKGKIDHVIISWHWARIEADKKMRFEKEDLPDLLVVDEAHHARIRKDHTGENPTQLHILLKELQKYIPHIILASATPFQTDIIDYYSLLCILGVPNDFLTDLLNYSRLFQGKTLGELNTQVRHLKQTHKFLIEYNLYNDDQFLVDLKESKINTNTKFYENYLFDKGYLTKDMIISTHPSSFLTTRNFRSTLAELGYKFPKPHFSAPKIPINEKQKELLQDIDDYIQNYLGITERLTNKKSGNIGLLRSLYRQRIVSSFKAAYDSLTNRKEKLEEVIKHADPSYLKSELDNEFDSSTNDEFDALPKLNYRLSKSVSLAVVEKARTEMYRIRNSLLPQIERLMVDGKLIDPKIAVLKDLLKQHTSKGRKVIVFSRFTSTTGAIVNELMDLYNTVGVGRFDGQCVGMYKLKDTNIELQKCTRKEIVENLSNGKIKILICSDAASEGLNLHTANVVINVDVPWNPTRLQQRFGRVDRLGQKASDVFLVNLYYPDSIEERMYSVLEDRRTNIRAVLGEVPEIMSQQQKKAINDLSDDKKPIINLTLKEVEKEISNYRKGKIYGLKTLSTSNTSDKSLSEELFNILKDSPMLSQKPFIERDYLTLETNDVLYSLNPMEDCFVSFGNDKFSEFDCKQKEFGDLKIIKQIETISGIPLFLVICEDDNLIPITSKNWPMIFKFVFLGEAFNTSKMKKFSIDQLNDLLDYMRKEESWIWPNHQKITCISSISPDMPIDYQIKIGNELGFLVIK